MSVDDADLKVADLHDFVVREAAVLVEVPFDHVHGGRQTAQLVILVARHEIPSADDVLSGQDPRGRAPETSPGSQRRGAGCADHRARAQALRTSAPSWSERQRARERRRGFCVANLCGNRSWVSNIAIARVPSQGTVLFGAKFV
eukprot:scaffold680_cov264-Pinguiococcus_pyrenoidosus.AAC.21